MPPTAAATTATAATDATDATAVVKAAALVDEGALVKRPHHVIDVASRKPQGNTGVAHVLGRNAGTIKRYLAVRASQVWLGDGDRCINNGKRGGQCIRCRQ